MIKERRKKAQHMVGIEPMTSRVLLRRRELFRCATTAALLNRARLELASYFTL